MSYDNLSSVSQNVLKFYQQLTGEERRIPFIFDDFHFCRSRVIGLDMTENRIFTLCRMITWVVFLRISISSYSFGATALIFCRMFIHIMEVCMSTGFWWSGGVIICVLQTHFIFKKSPNKTTLSIIIKCGGILLF
jgi:hypothetical protein